MVLDLIGIEKHSVQWVICLKLIGGSSNKMQTKFFRFAFCIACAILITSCDQDPFRMAYRKIAGDYYLHRWEDGKTYYLEDKTQDKPGGAIDGVVEEIGWNKNYIFVKRRSIFGGDKNGWMIIEIKNKKIRCPLAGDTPNIPEAKDVSFMKPEKAWSVL